MDLILTSKQYIFSLLRYISSFSRISKKIILISTDIIMLSLSFYLATILSYNSFSIYGYITVEYFIYFVVDVISIIFLFNYKGIYRSVLKYSSISQIISVVVSITLTSIGLIIFSYLYNGIIFPLNGIITISCFISIFNTVFIRFFAQKIIYSKINNNDSIHVGIYGAGDAGVMLTKSILQSDKYTLKAIFDDNVKKTGTVHGSINIYSTEEISTIIDKEKIQMILLAMPSIRKKIRKEILKKLSKFDINVMELPSVENIIDGKVTIEDIRKINIEELLGREIAKPINQLLRQDIENKNVLITGAGGSIGSELCRQVINFNASSLILYDNSEFSLYTINKELSSIDANKIIPILGSVVHKKRLINIFKKYKINTVYHAAAYKHVPMIERNPCAGAYNNIIGTYNCALTAMENNVDSFILISTDKAVRPTNVMGATKRFSELLIKSLSDYNENNTKFTAVRFGNVINSAGSVVPLFRKQIKNGGPITVTHPKIIRYFMSIPEAAQLVIQAGSLSNGGDVFLLDMGKPINIFKMAKKMIYLSGLSPIDKNNPNGDIKIEITGLRPGEKLYEELLVDNNSSRTKHPHIFKDNESNNYNNIINYISEINDACKKQNSKEIINILVKTVDGYQPKNKN